MNLRSVATLARILAAITPFALMCLRSSRINLKRSERGHQFLLPVVAVVYCLFAMLTINQINTALVRGVNVLTGLASFLPRFGPLLRRGLTTLSRTLMSGYGIQLLCNTALMTMFCGVKHAALPVIRRWWEQWKPLYELTAGHFYERNGDRLQLRAEFGQLRQFFCVGYFLSVVLGVVDCALLLAFPDSEAFHFPFYPVFSIIVLGEISFFLNGCTPDEEEQSDGEEEQEQEQVSCDEVLDALRELFPDRLMRSGAVPRQIEGREQRDWELELEQGDALDQVAGAYFNAMQRGGEPIHPDYVRATCKLLHRKSVLFYNPFYHDLTEYLLLPVFHTLLNHEKCLVICGRTTSKEDIQTWLSEGAEGVTNLPRLWQIAQLDSRRSGEDVDIGIMSFERFYELSVLSENERFFGNVGMVILLEPSNLMGTGQVGLRNILQHCEREDKTMTYCILERNADGVVDAMSHVIRQSITEVVASGTTRARHCRAFWRAEGPGMQGRLLPGTSHYFGIGGEIAALAMHEGVDNIHWFSGSKMPLLDLRWSMGQYYVPLCKYAQIPAEQSELDLRIHFHENLWQAREQRDAFVLVEDEFCNAFEMARTFGARIEHRGFLNVLSESYLLRDYMCGNEQLFTNDPKAIPSMVPDYARTERNLVLRLLMLMATGPVPESVLSRELSLYGCETRDPHARLCQLIVRHTGIENPRIRTIRDFVWVGGKRFSRFAFCVDRSMAEEVLDSALKSAFYVVENEETGRYLMGNRLMGHIEQVLLPGQFFCYDGKYYQARSISPQNGIIVRRAADYLSRRVYYRQLRCYAMQVEDWLDNVRDVRGMKLQSCFVSCSVETGGYLEMKAANDLPGATVVHLSKVRSRSVYRKETMKLLLPGASAEVRFTLCVLFNELFQTLYHNESGYLTAVTALLPDSVRTHPLYADRIRALVPELKAPVDEQNGIFFLEDSNIDLGLLVSLERNIQRVMEILADYLDWYLDPGRKRAGDGEEPPPPEDGQDEQDEQSGGDAAMHADQTAEGDVDGEDEELQGESKGGDKRSAWLRPMEYLTYGFEEEPEWLALAETLEYLNERQFNDSNLQRARKVPPSFDDGSDYDPAEPGTHYCDFCGAVLTPGRYDVLKDGRERCPECSKDAIKSRKEFRKVFSETMAEMEEIFGITIDVPVKVRMANAKKVNEPFSGLYKPSPRSDPRVLGYAQKSRKGCKLLVENGAPRWKMKSTLVHELTHIWQYTHWDDGQVDKVYAGKDARLVAVEGMAVWTEVQYLLSMGEKERAVRYKRNRDADQSEYGVGMKKYLAKYPPTEQKTVPKQKSPFGRFPPI